MPVFILAAALALIVPPLPRCACGEGANRSGPCRGGAAAPRKAPEGACHGSAAGNCHGSPPAPATSPSPQGGCCGLCGEQGVPPCLHEDDPRGAPTNRGVNEAPAGGTIQTAFEVPAGLPAGEDKTDLQGAQIPPLPPRALSMVLLV